MSGGLDGLGNPSGAPGQFGVAVVPEPTSWILLGQGIAGLILFAGRRGKRALGEKQAAAVHG